MSPNDGAGGARIAEMTKDHPKAIPLLIVGAGPFGLAVSAYAGAHHISHTLVGHPMEFWKANMPKGMYLRSGPEWHLDPMGEATIERFLAAQNVRTADVDPLSLEVYLRYCDWFQQQKGLPVCPGKICRVNFIDGPSPHFEAELHTGEMIAARNVVMALGFRYFAHVPEPYPTLFPPGRFAHTSEFVDLSRVKGQRVLIIGGRQSGFEWAALSREEGAEAVYMSYRHATPSFEPSDWSWVDPIVDSMVDDPGWFRRLTTPEKEDLIHRFWTEGRRKLEPWLANRIANERITLFPHTHVISCTELSGGALEVELSDGTAITVDCVVLATGYKVDVSRIPMLRNGNVLAQLHCRNGFPVLDDHLQSNLPGLFFTSQCATQDFGPFFGFTVSVRTSAKLIGAALVR